MFSRLLKRTSLRQLPSAKDMRLQGLGLAFFLWAVATSSVLSQGVSNGAPQPVVLLAEITGVIGPATAHYAERAIEQARARQAEALIFRLDTPGGLLTSTREIVKAIIASPVPIIGFVAPSGAHAASAGTYILYATSIAAMAPGTNIGAATPVQIGGRGVPGLPSPDEGQEGKKPPQQPWKPRRRTTPSPSFEVLPNFAAETLSGLRRLCAKPQP